MLGCMNRQVMMNGGGNRAKTTEMCLPVTSILIEGLCSRHCCASFDGHAIDEARAQKWKLIEFAAADLSTALRIGAIHELTYMITYDRGRAISLFEQLMSGHSVLLESEPIREFLYWAFPKNFLRLCPFVAAMMVYTSEQVQERGSQLACIAALSTKAMESAEAQAVARKSSGAMSHWAYCLEARRRKNLRTQPGR